MKTVSAETERRLRTALVRLLAGQATATDGRLTVANLAREAGVARATANRADAVLAELRRAAALERATSSTPIARGEDERSRHADEHILAQHIQVRALLRGEEQRRAAVGGKVVPIIRR